MSINSSNSSTKSNPRALRLIAIIGGILTVLVGIDGLYMVLTHYQPSDVNNYNLSDGATVLVAAALLLIVSVAAFILSNRANTAQAIASAEAKQPESKIEPEVNA